MALLPNVNKPRVAEAAKTNVSKQDTTDLKIKTLFVLKSLRARKTRNATTAITAIWGTKESVVVLDAVMRAIVTCTASAAA